MHLSRVECMYGERLVNSIICVLFLWFVLMMRYYLSASSSPLVVLKLGGPVYVGNVTSVC